MEDDTSTPPTESIERRTFLAGVGAAGFAGLAGCGGDGDDTPGDTSDPGGADPGGSNGGGDPTPTDAPATTSDDQGDGLSVEDISTEAEGGGGDCPSTPLSYTSREWPTDDPYVTFEIPQGPYVSPETSFAGLRLVHGNSPTTTIRVNAEDYSAAEGYSEESVDERAENANGDEATEEYDVASGVRVFTTPGAYGDVPGTTYVFLPSGSGSVQVTIPVGVSSDEMWCPEVIEVAHRHLVESMRTV